MAKKSKALKYDAKAELLLRQVDAKRYQDWAKNKDSFQDYQSFINVSSTHSMGRKHRLWCEKQCRIVDLMSDGEYRTYKHLIWSTNVVAVQEQFALNPTTTFKVASELGYVHPYSYKLHVHHIMSTDFIVTTVKPDGTMVKHAYSYKPKFDPNKASRTKQKLKIESEYWAQQSVPFTVLTEDDVVKDWIHTLGFCELHYDPSLPTEQLALFTNSLITLHEIEPWKPLRKLLSQTAGLFNITQQIAERLFKNAVLRGFLMLDMNRRVKLNEAITLRGAA